MKLKQILYIPVIIFVCFILQACPENFDDGTETDVCFVNKSKSTIYLLHGIGRYPYQIHRSFVMGLPKLSPGQSFSFYDSQDNINKDSVVFEVYNIDTIAKYQNNDIVGDKADTVIVCGLESLKRCNFTIIYRPFQK